MTEIKAATALRKPWYRHSETEVYSRDTGVSDAEYQEIQKQRHASFDRAFENGFSILAMVLEERIQVMKPDLTLRGSIRPALESALEEPMVRGELLSALLRTVSNDGPDRSRSEKE